MESSAGIPIAVWVAIIAAIGSFVATGLNLISMRKPREADAATSLTDSASGLVGRLETRLDKLEKKYCELERRYDELEMDYKELELAFREVWDGSQENISQLKELDKTPVYEPENGAFWGSKLPWSRNA